MRIGLLFVVAAMLPACGSNWKAYGIDTACERELYFTDSDGDLWGDPEAAGEESCTPPPGTARNNRDCDDDDAPEITGRTGSLCPEHLVHHDASDPSDLTEFTALIDGSEFIVVHADTDLVWPAAAEDACGPWGWGGCVGEADECGHLATVESQPQLNALIDALPSGQAYAGWVGFHPTDHTWGYRDSTGAWIDDDAEIAALQRLCDTSRTYDPGTLYLALVVDAAGDWCLGTPEEANPGVGDPAYLPLYGHFICERPIPDPDQFALEELPPDE
ncbi:MAG: hypothetical protein JRI25_01820 [Deltaproteobacteria bacterium]|nr:hypothetical protein [Deltaproteobacteria bacterium]